MSFSHPTPWLSDVLDRFAAWLDRRTALRLPLLLLGALLASGRRTATSWFRAAGITDEFRPPTTPSTPPAAVPKTSPSRPGSPPVPA